MKIEAIQINPNNLAVARQSSKNKITRPQISDNRDGIVHHYQPTFGYCFYHIGIMKSTNEKLANSVKNNLGEYQTQLNKISSYKEKLKFMKNAHQKAAQLVMQYSSYQYSMAEMIPSYALECSGELQRELNNSKIFADAKDILLTLGAIQKLKTKAGIDRNTQKTYTKEQAEKSQANSRLYSSVILLDLLDKQILNKKVSQEDLPLVQQMRELVSDAISSVYGKDAYEKIQAFAHLGESANVEDKKESLKLLEKFDKDAQDLDFGESFYVNLDKLLNYKATTGNSIESDLSQDLEKIPTVVLHYHTHPKEIHINTSNVKINVNKEHDNKTEYPHNNMHEQEFSHVHKLEDVNK